jgi:hypothetical protein
VYWSVDATDLGSFANVFVGTIEGDRIRGRWVDLPGSPSLFGGALTLRIESNNRLVKVDESPCCYGAREWVRQGIEGAGSEPAGPGLAGPGPTGPGPAGPGPAGPGLAGPAPEAADWGYTTGQRHRGNIGQRYTYACPPNGTLGSVWGTDVYTDDSSICTAAVHAGRITVAGGGTVTIEMVAGQSAYTGTARNGVSSANYGSWSASFQFVP